MRHNSGGEKLNVVLVGGSFIAMEAAGYFSDKANTLVMSINRPFERAFGQEVSNKIMKLHEDKKVGFLIDPKLKIIEFKGENNALKSIVVSDGVEIKADLCILAIGGIPCTEFLRNTPIKLTLENYVIVDRAMKTNVENVFAVGDIAYFPRKCLSGLEFTQKKGNPKLDHVNISHWGLANTQGRVAALNIVSADRIEKLSTELDIVPFFWSTQFNKSIRFAGFNDHYDSIVFHEDPSKQNQLKFAAFYVLKKRVVAVCSLDYDPVCALFAEALHNRIQVRVEDIQTDPMNLKNLINNFSH